MSERISTTQLYKWLVDVYAECVENTHRKDWLHGGLKNTCALVGSAFIRAVMVSQAGDNPAESKKMFDQALGLANMILRQEYDNTGTGPQ